MVPPRKKQNQIQKQKQKQKQNKQTNKKQTKKKTIKEKFQITEIVKVVVIAKCDMR